MSRSRTARSSLGGTARSSVRIAVLFAASATLLIAGCQPGSAGTGGGGASGGTPSAAATGTSSASPGSGTGSTDLFPAVVGDTWVYHDTITGVGGGTTTNKITAVRPVATGRQVTIISVSHLPKLPSTPTTLTYVLHQDGSISVPLAQIGSAAGGGTVGSTVRLKSGSIVWPSKAVLDSGKAHTSTLVLSITAAGRSLTVRAHVTVKGSGTQSVTVPAGTYTATVVDQFISEKVEGVAVTVLVKIWLAAAVGPVKELAFTMTGDVSRLVSTEVLTSFTKG